MIRIRTKLKVVNRPNCTGWYIRPTEEGKTRWVFLSESKTEADRLALDYEKQRYLRQTRGINVQAGVHLAVERYLRDKCSTSLTTRKSQQRYEVVVKRFQTFLSNYPVSNVSDVTQEMVWDYLHKRHREGIADKTWNCERHIICNFFNYSLNQQWIERNPVSKIPQKKLTDPRVEHLNTQEIRTLLDALKERSWNVPYYELITALAYTGMRVNEAIHLTKQDVLLERGLLVIQEKVINGKKWAPKTKQMRFVPIPLELRPIIEKQMNTPGILLFPNTNGNLMGDRHVLAKLQRACKKAGLKKVHVHSLRHSFTSIASERNLPEIMIQEVLGHKSADMTRRYRHLRPDFLTKQFENFSFPEPAPLVTENAISDN